MLKNCNTSSTLKCLLLLALNFFIIKCHSQNIIVPYVWRQVDFTYGSDAERTRAVQDGSFVPSNVIINDVDVWDDAIKGNGTGGKRIFLSTPRVRSGIPITLSTVTNIRNRDSFLLSPFPNWSTHTIDGECTGIISVDKIHIDKCGLLWVIDTGRINEFVAPRRVCQPKILIYDLKSDDNLIERYEVPDGVITDRSSLTTTITDSRTDNCRDSIAYIADLNGNGLVVFDLYQRMSWRVDHNHFYPYPLYGTFTIAGVTFDLMDGVFGMALGPVLQNGDRLLFFHSLASIRESWVSTSAIRNTTLSNRRDLMRNLFSVSSEFREGQSSLEIMTENGILIYSVLPRNALACWNTATEPIRENTQIIYENFEHMQFVSGMKIKKDTLWIATNRVQYEFSSSNASAVNADANASVEHRMRIIIIKSVNELLKNSVCSSPRMRVHAGQPWTPQLDHSQFPSSNNGPKPPIKKF